MRAGVALFLIPALALGPGWAGPAWAQGGAPPGPKAGAGAADQRPTAQRVVVAGEDKAQGGDAPALEQAPALGDLLGKPIDRIEVTAEGGRWPRVESITTVELGEPLSPEAARRALRELLVTGSFARAAAQVTPTEDGEGAVLQLFVLPRRLVATIKITGGALDPAATLEAARVAEGGEVTAPMLADIRQRILEFYGQRGYPAARVKVDAADTDDPMRVVLAIDIAAGAPRTIAQRVFVITPAADREIGPLKTRYRFGSGDRVDEPAFTEADREMAELLRKNGFHRAEVSHRVVNEGQRTELHVLLEPGPRIVPAFDGNRVFDDDALEDALDLEEAPDTKPAALAERLRAFYVQRGFLDVEIEPEERGRASDPVHYLVFRVREHEQVRVVKRVFPCLTGELKADDVGQEIQSFLEEDLPGSEFLSLPDPTAVGALFGPTAGEGGRAKPVELNPAVTYDAETYERALNHVRDLYYARGYLNAVVGPVSVLRATCSKRSPPGRCLPEPTRERVTAQCRTDEHGLPLPEPPVPKALMCEPDPARGIECAPEVTLRIPVHPGPQTVFYDLAFEGNKTLSEEELAGVAELTLGGPLSTLDLDAARLRILDHYRDLGYAYAEVRAAVDPSPDRTRARARFVITERDRVVVTGFVIKGATRTDRALILGRLALREGQPYRQNRARLSEERIATLGTFASVSVSLEDPDVPQRNKRVVITVAEQLPQYLDPRIGFSTGEGLRFAFEYGHRNIGGQAIALTLRVQLSRLFDFMIVDEDVRLQYKGYSGTEKLERRNNISLNFPEIGLGPLVSLSLDGIDVRDNQRDFGLTKQAFIPTLTYRPRRAITSQLNASVELNDVDLCDPKAEEGADLEDIRRCELKKRDPTVNRLPAGNTIALAQRISGAWDARDSPFAATKGVLITSSLEHVNAFPTGIFGNQATIEGHFLRATGRVSGYVPLPAKGVSVALSMSAGHIVHLNAESQTYPDRLFFMGGVDSLRSFTVDSVVPEDVAQRILSGEEDPQGGVFTIDKVLIRGGDLALNPRAELRFPLGTGGTLQGGVFLDAGNLWVDPTNFDPFAMRYAAGAGLRIVTPIGPIAFDYGINLIRREWEDFGAFHFSIGLF